MILLLAAILVSSSPDWTPPPCGNGPVAIHVIVDDWCPIATRTPLPMVRMKEPNTYQRATPINTPKSSNSPTPVCRFQTWTIPCMEPCKMVQREMWTDWPECGGKSILVSPEWNK